MLDEGIDVPDANLGVVMSASRTRRQMIQRMGRILRRKRAGVAARFVIMFAKDTLEDPANRIERDGFLDEIERISEATGVFDSERFDELDAFLAAPGPDGRARARAPRELRRAPRRRGRRPRRSRSTPRWSTRSSTTLGVEAAYALLHASPAAPTRHRVDAGAIGALERAAPAARRTTVAYLELELAPLPDVAKPKVVPKRLSTGQVALEIARVGDAWRISCTGCGEASPPVQFRWQVLDQTVACRCN